MEAEVDPRLENKSVHKQCVNCHQSLSREKGKSYSLSSEWGSKIGQFIQNSSKISIDNSEHICTKCYTNIKRQILKNVSPSFAETSQESPQPSSQKSKSSQELSFDTDNNRGVTVTKVLGSEKRCFVCAAHCRNRVPNNIRKQVFFKRRIYVPEGYRCCGLHYFDDQLQEEDIINIKIDDSNNYTLENEKYFEFFDMLCESEQKIKEPFERDEDYKIFTGLTKDQFDQIHTKYIINLKESEKRTTRQALALYLMKLRTGHSNQELIRFIDVTKRSISRIINSVRTELLNNLVKNQFSPENWSRDLIEDHMSEMVKTLHCPGDSVATMWDGTYAYIQKSNDNAFQRNTYSVQKGKPLIKPMIGIASDGFILGIFGPYKAKDNDANIMDRIIREFQVDFNRIFTNQDVFIVDRGFRDSKLLNNYVKAMPTCIPPRQQQMTTIEANETRKVTKVRYKIEVVNGILKRNKLLSRIRVNSSAKNIMDDWKIAGALYNEFFQPIESDKGCDKAIANLILERQNIDCSLKNVALEFDRKKTVWKKFDQSVLNQFPKLKEEDIRFFTLGTYQVKMCKSYVFELLSRSNPRNSFEIEYCVHPDYKNFFRTRIQSRHTESKQYNVYIQYEPNGESFRSIPGYYCKCKSGCRTIGCCSHVCAIVWFLSYARHNNVNLDNFQNMSAIFESIEVEESENEKLNDN